MSRPTRSIPFLIFSGSVVPHTILPGMDRPEPYGYPRKEANYFCAHEDRPFWERFIGWHDWAVLLNIEAGRLFNDARACLEHRHPISQMEDGRADLSFREFLVAGFPQFLLSVWELELNGWSRLISEDPVSRVLLDVRQARPVCGYRSAVDAAFVESITLARVLQQRLDLKEALIDLRQRHSRHHAVHPWCWLRYFCERQQAYDILCMLEGELLRWQGSAIVTPEQLRCERWHKSAHRHFYELMQTHGKPDHFEGNAVFAGSNPGFDWSLRLPESVDVDDLARCIVRTISAYNHNGIAEELANEVEYVSQWMNRLEDLRMADEMQDHDVEWQDQGSPSEVEEQSSWFDCDPASDSRYRHGPLSGTLKQLAKWMNGPSQPTLRSKNGKSYWYIRKLMGRSFSVWFDSQRKFSEANQRQLAESQSKSKPTK